jgi:alpha-1,3-mannosyltransferase
VTASKRPLYAMPSQWLIGCILFSLGVSVKMNVLLFAPALLLLLLRNLGVFSTIGHLAVCAAVQVSFAVG